MVPSPPGTPAPASAAAGHQQATATVSTSAPSAAPSTSTFAAPNIQKDLPSSPTPRPFWGGQHLGGLGNGGVTPVHTTLIPEINVSLWGSVAGPAANVNGVERPSAGGKNINPLLNAIGAGVTGVAAVRAKESREEKEKLVPMPVISGFDAFADANLFTMKSLDAYVSFFPFSFVLILIPLSSQVPDAIMGQNGGAAPCAQQPSRTTSHSSTRPRTSTSSLITTYRSGIPTPPSVLLYTISLTQIQLWYYFINQQRIGSDAFFVAFWETYYGDVFAWIAYAAWISEIGRAWYEFFFDGDGTKGEGECAEGERGASCDVGCCSFADFIQEIRKCVLGCVFWEFSFSF